MGVMVVARFCAIYVCYVIFYLNELKPLVFSFGLF